MTAKKNRRPVLPHETYTVVITRDAETGVAVYEQWLSDGNVNRPDGPASIVRDAITGIVVRETWFKDNEIHREDGPAVISRQKDTGRVFHTEWFRDGQKIPAPVKPHTSSRASARPSLPSSQERSR